MPDKHGYVSLSLSNTYERRMIDAADLVILEINPNMPYTLGSYISVDEVDYFVQASYEAPTITDAPYSEKDIQIGKYIADMVPDGSCIQLGIGGIPNAVAAALENKNDLGVHTEMLTTGMMKLAQMGVITGKNKQAEKSTMVCAFALGSKELYEFMDYNPARDFWINDEIYGKREYSLIKSTYLDNEYLAPQQIKEIEFMYEICVAR